MKNMKLRLVVILVVGWGLAVAAATGFSDVLQDVADQTSLQVLVPIKGIDYGPFRSEQQPGGPCPGLSEIQADLAPLRLMANTIRTYGLSDCGIGEKVLTAVQATPSRVFTGLWVGSDAVANATEISELTQLRDLGLLSRVRAVVVGSEALWRGDQSIAGLLSLVRQVRAIVPDIPVTVAEQWHIWAGIDSRYSLEQMADLAAEIDFVFVNIHPYWEGVCADQAATTVFDHLATVRAIYPQQQVVISETGWPTAGETIGCAVPSVAGQEDFLDVFLTRAKSEATGFFIFEAFDEPWKGPAEAEKHWGLYQQDRTAKHAIRTLRFHRGVPQ